MKLLYWQTYKAISTLSEEETRLLVSEAFSEETRLLVSEAFSTYVAAHTNQYHWQKDMIPKADRYETCIPFRPKRDIEYVAQTLTFVVEGL